MNMSNNTPIISVIMAVFNAEDYLVEAIESIINQSITNIEIIIINDGSTDKSLSIIEGYAKLDSRIIYKSRENKGLIYSLNEGIQLSKGQYIARMDADDIALPQRLKLQYEFIENNQLDICGGDYITIDEKGIKLKDHITPKHKSDIFLSLLANVPFAHPTVFIRKKFLLDNQLQYGLNGHRHAEDLDLWIRMFDAGARFGNVGEYILKYRSFKQSLSSSNHKNIKKEANQQHDIFTKNHISDIQKVLNQFCRQTSNTNDTEKIVAKALMRYLYIKFDFPILFECFMKMNKVNFLYGFVSFIKSKM